MFTIMLKNRLLLRSSTDIVFYWNCLFGRYMMLMLMILFVFSLMVDALLVTPMILNF